MAKKPETKFREKVDRLLKTIPNSCFESIQQKSIRGTPDKIGCVAGLFVALELKAGDGEATELQRHKLSRFAIAGGFTRVVNEENLNDVITTLCKIGMRD